MDKQSMTLAQLDICFCYIEIEDQMLSYHHFGNDTSFDELYEQALKYHKLNKKDVIDFSVER